MKLIYYLLFSLTINLYSQDYRLINKAEKILNSENPNFENKSSHKWLRKVEKISSSVSLLFFKL